MIGTHWDYMCQNELCRQTPEILQSNTTIFRIKGQPDKAYLQVMCLNKACNLYTELPPGVSLRLAEFLGCLELWIDESPPSDVFAQFDDELQFGLVLFRPLEHRDDCLLRYFHFVLFERDEPQVPLADADEWRDDGASHEVTMLAAWLAAVTPERIWQELRSS